MYKKNQKGAISIVFILLIVAAIFVGGLSLYNKKLDDKIAEYKIIPVANIPSHADLVHEENAGKCKDFKPEYKHYVSEDLGIKFDYQKTYCGVSQPVTVIEEGNSICLGHNDACHQFVEVFSKSAGASLQEAVTETFLSDKDSQTCWFEYRTPFVNSIEAMAGSIYYTVEDFGDWELREAAESYCPRNAVGGGSYFFMRENRPEVFFFVSIGHDAMNGNANALWQDTIEIF